MKGPSYIGVSGFMRRGEVDDALLDFPPCGRLLMVGVLLSWKTLFEQGNSKPLRYPKPQEIARIWSDDHRCLNLVHYGADNDDYLGHALRLAMCWGGSRCHGVQVNVAGPAPAEIANFREAFPDAIVVLQIGPRALPEYTGEQGERVVVEKLMEYGDTITNVLVDVSGGEGIALDPLRVLPMIAAIRRALPGLAIGVAGGLCAETLPSIAPIVRAFPDVSTDAEGRVRDGALRGGNLVADKVRAYLAAAGRFIGSPT